MERLRKRAHRSLPGTADRQTFVTELVAVQPPEPLATFLADGLYLPRGIPMLKRVLALPGQTVCRDRLTVTVDNIEVGKARERDSRGRPLPDLAGLSRHRRRRSVPHELAVGGFPRWALFWSAANERDCRNGRSLFGPTRRSDRATSQQTFCHSFVRSEHGPFLRPGQSSHRHCAQRRLRAAVRPSRQRFNLEDGEHDRSACDLSGRSCASSRSLHH